MGVYILRTLWHWVSRTTFVLPGDETRKPTIIRNPTKV